MWPVEPAWRRRPRTTTSAPRTTFWPRCSGAGYKPFPRRRRPGADRCPSDWPTPSRAMVLFTTESPGPGRRLHGGAAQLQSRREAPPRPDRGADPSPPGRRRRTRGRSSGGPGAGDVLLRIAPRRGHGPHAVWRHPRPGDGGGGTDGRIGRLRAPGRAGSPDRANAMSSDDRRTGHLQPLCLRDPRGSLPGLCQAPGRGAGLSQPGVRFLGAVPARGRPRRLPQRGRLLQRLRRLPRPERIRTPTPTR